MEIANETRKKLISARNRRKWDNKDWARAIGVSQRTLEGIDDGSIDLSGKDCEDLVNMILEATRLNKLPKLMRFKKPQVIAFDIHKGGGGKTTMAVNISYELAKRGYNVLLVDADAQGDSTTTVLSSSVDIRSKNLFECLNDDYLKLDIRNYIFNTEYDNLDVVPYSHRLEKLETILSATAFREKVFHQALTGVMKDNYYDFVFVDMDKSLGLLNTSVLCGSDYMIIPAECAQYHLKGLVVMKEQYELVKQYNPDFDILGVVFNKVDLRKQLKDQAKETVDAMFPGLLFDHMLRVESSIERSQWEGVPVGVYSKSSRAYKEIKDITDEMLDRIKGRMEV